MVTTCFPKEQHLTFSENQKGVTYDMLFAPYFENATQGTCTYMVSKANVMDIRPLFPNNERIYPSKKIYEDRFSVKCHPTLIYLVNDEKITVELGEDAL